MKEFQKRFNQAANRAELRLGSGYLPFSLCDMNAAPSPRQSHRPTWAATAKRKGHIIGSDLNSTLGLRQ